VWHWPFNCNIKHQLTVTCCNYLVLNTTLRLSAYCQAVVLITGRATCQEILEIHNPETVFSTTEKNKVVAFWFKYNGHSCKLIVCNDLPHCVNLRILCSVLSKYVFHLHTHWTPAKYCLLTLFSFTTSLTFLVWKKNSIKNHWWYYTLQFKFVIQHYCMVLLYFQEV
jgi:hypothetical protein